MDLETPGYSQEFPLWAQGGKDHGWFFIGAQDLMSSFSIPWGIPYPIKAH